MRTMRAAILLASILVIAAACSDNGVTTEPSSVPPPATTSTSSEVIDGTIPPAATTTVAPTTQPSPTGTSPPGSEATVADLIDGDSFTASVDGQDVEVRLLGLNTPERNTCFGIEARDRLAALLANGFILVEDPSAETDQFDRLLRHAYVGERNVAETMIKEGYAIALASDHSERDQFRRVYRQAINTNAGMWAREACGAAAATDLAIDEIEFNPRGPDSDDLNGEWVVLRNVGTAPVDFTGWTLRDESSRNRYSFPDGFTLGEGQEVQIRVGCGTDGSAELFWCSDAPVFNNSGDSAIVQDALGNVAAVDIYEGAG